MRFSPCTIPSSQHACSDVSSQSSSKKWEQISAANACSIPICLDVLLSLVCLCIAFMSGVGNEGSGCFYEWGALCLAACMLLVRISSVGFVFLHSQCAHLAMCFPVVMKEHVRCALADQLRRQHLHLAGFAP